MTQPTPARLPIPNGRQLTLRLTQAGQEAAIVLGFIDDGAATTASQAADVQNAAWNAFKPLIYSDVTLVGSVWRDVSEAEADAIEVPPPSGTGAANGAAGGTASVAAASTLIRWATGGGGRSGRGRTYLPGLATVSVAAGGREYTTSYRTTVTSQITAYLANSTWTTVGVRPAVLSFTKGAAREIVTGSLSPIVGVQRRRMRG